MFKDSDNRDILDSIYALSEKAEIGLILVDENLNIVEINDSAISMLGALNDVRGSSILDIIDSVSKEKVVKLIKKREFSVESKKIVHHIKGERVEINWTISPVHTGDKFRGCTISLKNITESERDRKRLESSERMLDSIFRYAPIGIYQIDHSGRFITANPEFAWMLGYESPEKLVYKIKDAATQLFFDHEKGEEFFVTLLESEEINRFRCRLKRNDGSFLWVLSYAKATKNALGKIDSFFCFSIDITHTIRNEERMESLNMELREISMIDGLTKIANRRKFDEYIENEWKRMGRENRNTISMILCDIDFFKLYNDTYGHQTGDDCLKKVAKAIKESVKRPTDLVARYGGEEFVVLLPETDIDGARYIAETIRERVKGLKIEHKSSKIADIVTISLGTGTIDDLSKNPEDLIKMSDLALYKAKAEGRDRVC